MALLARIPDRLIDEIRVDYLGKCPSSAVDDVGRFLKDMLARIDRESIVERILEIDQDYLGIYEPGKIAGTIGIHWALITLCASRLGVSMEALSLKYSRMSTRTLSLTSAWTLMGITAALSV